MCIIFQLINVFMIFSQCILSPVRSQINDDLDFELNSLERICKDLVTSGEAWNLISRADPDTDALNVAFPDFAAEYWVSCLNEGDRPLFWGGFPDWAHYSALTAYDMYGLEIDGASVESKYYNNTFGPIDLMKDIETNGSFSVFFRIYSPYDNDTNQYRRISTASGDDERFEIQSLVTRKFMPSANISTAIANANLLERRTKRAIRVLTPKIPSSHYKQQFRYADTADLKGLFPNANAVYLIAFTDPDERTGIVKLTGKCQVPNDYLYFYDIMAVNQETTETTDAISFEMLGNTVDGKKTICYENESFVVFVTKKFNNRNNTMQSDLQSDLHAYLQDYGYDSENENHHIIWWNDLDSFPAIVVRYLIDIQTADGNDLIDKLRVMDGNIYNDTLRDIGVPEIEYYGGQSDT